MLINVQFALQGGIFGERGVCIHRGGTTMFFNIQAFDVFGMSHGYSLDNFGLNVSYLQRNTKKWIYVVCTWDHICFG